ncbi:hypothetical protein LguiA_007091 [Lonicera macranthoides]
MPPKNYAAKKKSREEVCNEFHLALQRQQQPSQASQPSQHANEPSGSQQESPILPLVLPTPSNHSTTGSTGTTGLAIRSIRCTFATTNLRTEPGTAGTSSSNKRRGVVVGKKTAVITKEKGRTPVNYDDSVRGPSSIVRSRFVADLSAYIKDRCPMLHPSWYDLPETERTKLLEFLSVSYDIDSRRKELIVWIDEKASNRFREWKSYCHTDWQEKGDEPIPIEFAHRPVEWEWLCHHFRDPKFQKMSEQMKQVRSSSNKKSHSGGAKPFVFWAEENAKKGEQAPHSKTYVDVYKKFIPEVTMKVQQASDEAIASMMESMPPIEDTLDGSSPASVTTPLLPRLHVDVEIGIMEKVVGPSRGTRAPGLGSGVSKQPRRRGPSQLEEPINEVVEEELAELRAKTKTLEERLQQQDRERERERLEREKERLAWEARIQTQFEEMARHMCMGAPPSDGSNNSAP